jgi:hypothetical protein
MRTRRASVVILLEGEGEEEGEVKESQKILKGKPRRKNEKTNQYNSSLHSLIGREQQGRG